MEKTSPEIYDKYMKALMDISQAITSDLYLEDILKLIVMVTAKVTGVEICSLWLIDESERRPGRYGSKPPRPLILIMSKTDP